jgi:trafficking protein particle complex subunit 11
VVCIQFPANWWFLYLHPCFLLFVVWQLAANYLREKRCCLEQSSLSEMDLPTKITEAPDSVIPSIYIGQSARLVEEGDAVTVLP